MIVSCPNCHSKYNVSEEKIGNTPKKFRCRKCSQVFIIRPLGKKKSREDVLDEAKEERAARFARVLASDMLVYNKEQVEEARKNGNVPEIMSQEIQKSWELWKSRFPEVCAVKPEIFSEALNQFLGNGEKIFNSRDFS